MRARWMPVVVVAAAIVSVYPGLVTTLGGQAASDWLRVNVVQVVPERLEDYIELQINEVNPGMQRAGVPGRSVWRTA